MERKQDEVLHDKDENQTRNEEGVTYQISVLKPFSSSPDIEEQANAVDWGGGKHIVPSGDIDASGEVNMEASITPDDVIRAGGFGARDDISRFLPVASDSTDFEATIRPYVMPETMKNHKEISVDQVLAGQKARGTK